MRAEHIVTAEENGRHLRGLLESVLPNVPSKGIRRAIQRGQITVNKGKVPSNYEVKTGDNIFIHIQTSSGRKQNIELPVVVEDDYFAVIDKPAGISISGGRGATVSDFLKNILTPSTQEDALPMPKAVHRLDKPTQGALLIAKTKSALTDLSQQFELRRVQKTYHAVVHGAISTEGKVEIPVSDKTALSLYKPLKIFTAQDEKYTLVELKPSTGRTHQLRKHMAFIGHAIVGDNTYGKAEQESKSTLMLYATELSFVHPFNKSVIDIRIDLPDEYKSFLSL